MCPHLPVYSPGASTLGTMRTLGEDGSCVARLSHALWPHICTGRGLYLQPGGLPGGAAVPGALACTLHNCSLGEGGKDTQGKRSTQGKESGTEGGGEETVRHGGPMRGPVASY